MCLLLILLLLTPLVVPPVFSFTPNEKFKMQHTYNGNDLVNCNRDLNPILQSLNKACKPCNSFILGAQTYSTDMNDVNAVCGSGGVHQTGNLYKSKNDFRVVKCREKTSGHQPPNCDYKKLGQSDIKTTKITLACDPNRRPVHFEGC